MILYVNGDSHTTAAEAVNQYIVAGDDARIAHLGQLPHPDNIAISWGKMLSLALRYSFHCEAYVDNTTDNIIAATKKWLDEKKQDVLVIIQWPATTEDEEKIWQFHLELANQNIKHIFFNSSQSFNIQHDWNNSFISDTYEDKIRSANIETVSPNSKHFGKDGHSFWNRLLLNYIITNNFV